jgi:hypothetical protein
MAGFHSAMSPSKIEQFSICPASFQVSQGLPELPKFDAIVGTAAHEVHEWCLRTGCKAAERVLDSIEVVEPDRVWNIIVDDEMAVHVQESVDRCNELQGLSFTEVRVDITEFTPIPDQSGSSDHFVIDVKARTLYVIDFKYGKGVRVSAFLNPQLIYYGLGVLRGIGSVFEIDKVVIRIHQPRLDNWDEWRTTPAELIALGRHHKRLLTRCLEPNPPFHPDPKACRFCKARTQCKALAEKTRRVAAGMFEDLDADIVEFETPWAETLPRAELMTPEELAAVRRHVPLLMQFFGDVDKRVLSLLLHSQVVPGLKAVEGRSIRRYRDDVARKQAASFLVSHGVAPSKAMSVDVVSPAQAELLLPKPLRKKFGDLYVTKPPGKPTIALSDDKRPAYALTAADQFDDLGDFDESSEDHL